MKPYGRFHASQQSLDLRFQMPGIPASVRFGLTLVRLQTNDVRLDAEMLGDPQDGGRRGLFLSADQVSE